MQEKLENDFEAQCTRRFNFLYCFKISQVWAPYCRLVSSVLLSVSAEACLLAPLRLRWCRGHSSLSLHAPHTAAAATASSCARCRAPRAHPTAVRLEDGRGYRVHYSQNLNFLSEYYLAFFVILSKWNRIQIANKSNFLGWKWKLLVTVLCISYIFLLIEQDKKS